MTVLAAHAWATNADLIADVAELGYIKSDDLVLDLTYGKGVWWKRWRPDVLFTLPSGVDFRKVDHEDGSFDVIAYDPPYVSMGGRATTGLSSFFDRFGLIDAPRTAPALQSLMNEGLTEAHRLVRDKGIVLVKCQDYIVGGRLWLGTHHTLTHALELGFMVVDRLERVGRPRPQPPSNINQVHARRNYSTMFVLGKGRVWLRKKNGRSLTSLVPKEVA